MEAVDRPQIKYLRQAVISVPATPQEQILVLKGQFPQSRQISEIDLGTGRVVYQQQFTYSAISGAGFREKLSNPISELVSQIDAAQAVANGLPPEEIEARREKFLSESTGFNLKPEPLAPLFQQEQLKQQLEARLAERATMTATATNTATATPTSTETPTPTEKS